MKTTLEIEKLTRDNFNWFRMRWVSLIIHAVVLCLIALPAYFYLDKNTCKSALLIGAIIGMLVTRFAVSWQYETRILNALKTTEK